MARTSQTRKSVLTPADNCWQIARADRLRVIVDAADYFKAAKEVMLKARNTIFLVGWDFDTRIGFEPEDGTIEGPNKLGDFLSWLVARNDALEIRLLRWDLAAIESAFRGGLPLIVKDWLTDDRLILRLDAAHPPGATHHAKIILIDDSVAFCGGIDMTAGRWDTRDHLDDDPRRTLPGGGIAPAWHDVTTAVDGPVALAIGNLVRDRWERATEEKLPPADHTSDLWPTNLEPGLTDVDIAISRTFPEWQDNPEIREIENLYLTLIAEARQTLYFETQYFASRRIAEALAERLRDPQGPEIVIVMPETADGWLEAKAMDSARTKLINLIRSADRFDRFRIYFPVTAGRNPIYVHAKVTVSDNRFLRVGSSNLNNRSMGFDTECDLVVDAVNAKDETAARRAITDIRDDLICEHLAVSRDQFRLALAHASGRLTDTIDTLISDRERSLVPLSARNLSKDESILVENELTDPETASKGFGTRLIHGIGKITGILPK